MNRHSRINIQSIFRTGFGILLPVALSAITLMIALAYYSLSQQQNINNTKKLWRENARLNFAAIQSNYNFGHKITQIGNQMADSIKSAAANDDFSFSGQVVDDYYAHYFGQHHLNEGVEGWAFEYTDGQYKFIQTPSLASLRFRIMEMTFNNLAKLSTPDHLSQQQLSSLQRSLSSIFGRRSQPAAIAAQREGILTPITFSGNKVYLYWRRLSSDTGPIGGIMLLFPANRVEDIQNALQISADRFFAHNQRKLAMAFVPTSGLVDRLPIVLPSAFAADDSYKAKIIRLLLQVSPHSHSSNLIEQHIDGHIFLRDLVAIDLQYDAILFAPIPAGFNPEPINLKLIIFLFLMIWLMVFTHHYRLHGRIGLPLALSFRILILFSGIIPLSLVLFAGTYLINNSYQTSIAELKRDATKKLLAVTDKTNTLLPMFGDRIRKTLSDTNIRSLVLSANKNTRHSAFATARDFLVQHGFDLSFMFIYRPGHEPEILLENQLLQASAQNIFRYVTAAVDYLNESISITKKLPPIKLSSSLQSWSDALKTLGRESFTSTYFQASLESAHNIEDSDRNKNFTFSTVFTSNGQPQAYVFFLLKPEQILRNFIIHEINHLNSFDKNTFVLYQQQSDSDFAPVTGINLQVLQSDLGRITGKFVETSWNSQNEIFYTHNNQLLGFIPTPQFSRINAGVIISLAHLQSDRAAKFMFLLLFTLLMLGGIYLLASLTTAHLISPIGEIRSFLQAINKGDLNAKITTKRSDELGNLVNTLSYMFDGFKRRVKLGKFVSTTFETGIAEINSAKSDQSAKIIKGTVLFSDIRSFTTLSEQYSPQVISQMLNTHLEKLSEVIQKHGGQIEQFIGDAIVAFFPEQPKLDSKVAALNAAIAMYHSHKRLVAKRIQNGEFAYATGIGLAYGSVTSGILSTSERSEFVIIGQPRSNAEHYETASKKGRHSRIVVNEEYVTSLPDTYNFVTLADTGLLEFSSLREESA